jgi:hypothetical protein
VAAARVATWPGGFLLPSGEATTLATLTVPAGGFAFTAVVPLENLTGADDPVTCGLSLPGGSPWTTNAYLPSGVTSPVTLAGAATTTGGPAVLWCEPELGGAGAVTTGSGGALMALPVASVSVTAETPTTGGSPP